MPRNATAQHSPTETLSESELSESELESCLRILEAAIDSVPGYLSDVATHAGLTISETIRLGGELVSRGLLLALDDEPWAPTIAGFKLIQGRRADRREQHARLSAEAAVRTVSHSPISHCAACSRASVAAGQV